MKECLTYDDVLIVPQSSSVESRGEVSLSTNVTPSVEVDSPIISAPMDSVTESTMAQAMADEGGVGIVHRFCDIIEQEEMVELVSGPVGASIGIGEGSAGSGLRLEEAGADFICVDVAHAHLDKCVHQVELFSELLDVDLMVGNVATWSAAKDLIAAGADAIKIGIGPGSHCTTREKTGVGVPQFTAVKQISNQIRRVKGRRESEDVTIIADGGIQKPGDAMKALMAGADAVMMGGIFGRCVESPSGTETWGMASERGKKQIGESGFVEGEETDRRGLGYVEDVVSEFHDGIRSGMSYCGGSTIEESREDVEFVQTTSSSEYRNGAFAEE